MGVEINCMMRISEKLPMNEKELLKTKHMLIHWKFFVKLQMDHFCVQGVSSSRNLGVAVRLPLCASAAFLVPVSRWAKGVSGQDTEVGAHFLVTRCFLRGKSCAWSSALY